MREKTNKFIYPPSMSSTFYVRIFRTNEILAAFSMYMKLEKSSMNNTCSDPNFQKTAISETRENKNFRKNRLTHGLKVGTSM